MKLVIATSYFPISNNISHNLRYVLRHIREAKAQGADVVHFPEACLSGYAGADFETYKDFDWGLLKEATEKVLEKARSENIWVVLGSTHKLSRKNKPHNSLYIINNCGKIVDRYDKLFCAGPQTEDSEDLAHYSSGNYFCVFKINGIQCGTLICHDSRYPELYRQYKNKGVQVMFHSYHAGNISLKKWNDIEKKIGKQFHKVNNASTYPGIIFPATMQSMAANNFIFISCSNSSARQSSFPGFFVRADGIITGRLKRNVTGLLISNVDTEADLYDSTIAWRDRAISGTYHSGKLVQDERSDDRTTL